MQAALVTGQRQIELVDFPEPEPSEHRSVIEISYCGICGTDLHAFLSGDPYHPAICGHEWVGHVAATHSETFKEGDRVAIGVATACGQCRACTRGDAPHCEGVFASATARDAHAAAHGGFAPSIAFTNDRLYSVPTALSDEEAGLLEPATVAVHALRRTAMRLGDAVVVIGAGPIGLLIAQCAHLSGAGRLIVIEPEEGRRALASTLGATHVIDPKDGNVNETLEAIVPGGADVVFECAGIPQTIQQAVELSRRGGTVSLVGVASAVATIVPALWLIQEINLVSSIAYLNEDFELTKALAADGRLDLAPLHTSTVALDSIEDAFARLSEHPTEVKILVDPRL